LLGFRKDARDAVAVDEVFRCFAQPAGVHGRAIE
jgi:hypothetical protein